MHDEFKGLELELLRQQHPGAKVLVHPESPRSVVEQADVVGSTTQLLNAVVKGDAQEYIVATDNGLMHRMRQLAPGKTLIEAPTAGTSATCKSCAHCPWMAMNALQGVRRLPGKRQRRDPRRRAGARQGARLHRAHARLRREAPDRDREAGARLRAARGRGLMDSNNETLEQARERNIRDALAEDIGRGDWTAQLVPAGQRVQARVLVREDAVLCGREWFDGCLHALDAKARIDLAVRRGRAPCAPSPRCATSRPTRAPCSPPSGRR